MSSNLRGILAMLLSMASFVIGDAIIKHVGQSIPLGQMMVVRGLIACALLLAALAITGQLATLVTVRDRHVAARTLCDVGATFCFFSGLLRMPFADVAAIGQFTPLAVTAGAALFLGEPVGWRRWMATLVGLAGVLVIIRPGTSAFDWSALYIIAAVVFVSARDLITRRMGRTIPALAITTAAMMANTVAGAGLTIFETWQPLSASALSLLAVAALTVINGFFWIVVAMRNGDISLVAPFRYSVIVFALALGIVVFGERPDAQTYAGVAVIIAAGLYMFHRERIVQRGRNPTRPSQT